MTDPYAQEIAKRVKSGNPIPQGKAPCPTPGYEGDLFYTDTQAGKPAIWYAGQLYEKVSTGVAERIAQAIQKIGG